MLDSVALLLTSAMVKAGVVVGSEGSKEVRASSKTSVVDLWRWKWLLKCSEELV